MITIKKSDMSDLFNYIKWTIDNPSPCMKCYSYGTPECCGCIEESEYRKKKRSLPGAYVYNNMNYQKLADAYGRLYQALKTQQESIKAYNNAEDQYRKILIEYTVLNDTMYIKAGDIIESIPHDLARCPEVKISHSLKECGYHLRHDVQEEKYYVFKELFDLNDPEYPNRFKYLGVFDKHEYANRAILEDIDTGSKFTIE